MSTLQQTVSTTPAVIEEVITKFEAAHEERARIGAKFPASFLSDLYEQAEDTLTEWCAANNVPAIIKDLAIDMAMLYQRSTAIEAGHPEDANVEDIPDLVTDALTRIEQVKAL
jgi:hypothetical protein